MILRRRSRSSCRGPRSSFSLNARGVFISTGASVSAGCRDSRSHSTRPWIRSSRRSSIFGAIDDLWRDSSGRCIVVDYKSTAKDEPVTALDKPWHGGYKRRQMEVYQWLLRRNGYDVSDTECFVYCNGRKGREAFDSRLELDVTLIPYGGSDTWVEETPYAIKTCLDGGTIPVSGAECDYCAYRSARRGIEE